MRKRSIGGSKKENPDFTLAFHPLLEQAVQKRAAVVAESRTLEVVLLEAMRNVDFEAFLQVLKPNKIHFKSELCVNGYSENC